MAARVPLHTTSFIAPQGRFLLGTLSYLLYFLGIFSMVHGSQEALDAVTRGNTQFSFQLYDNLRKTAEDNLIVSPLSVATAAAMLQAGARGDTATAIRSALHFPADEHLNPGYQSLLQELQSDGNVTLEMANRVYPTTGFPLNPQYSATLKTYFGAEPHQLNYHEDSKGAAAAINSFVSQATHGKIGNLFQDLDPSTKLVVINAIYFKGTWKYEFPKDSTRKEDFYTNETASVKVNMMTLKTSLLYGEIPELDAKVVSLPYKGDRWSMVVLLPNKRTGLSEMEDKLKSVSLDKILQSMSIQKVILHLPKFKLVSNFYLNKVLDDLGIGVIFSRKEANFSGIPAVALKDNLYVSQAVQKAFIEVNEEGSEAAAVTGSVHLPDRPSLPDLEWYFNADHPFYSMIVHRNSGGNGQTTPVFMQRIAHLP